MIIRVRTEGGNVCAIMCRTEANKSRASVSCDGDLDSVDALVANERTDCHYIAMTSSFRQLSQDVRSQVP
jgi:hypothetical protein